jgi:hypothetical protein
MNFKKSLSVLVIILAVLASTGITVAGNRKTAMGNGLSANTEGKAKSIDARGPLEKRTFIHYKKIKNNAKPEKKPKSPRTPVCYDFLVRHAKWKTNENYIVNPVNNFGLEPLFISSAFATSVNAWDVQTSFDIFGSGSLDSTAVVDLTKTDGKNVVAFGDYSVDGVIAVTNVWGYFSASPRLREIVEWDMILDTDYVWGDGTVDSTVMDLQNIATHELGHSAGLADLYTTECGAQTMYGYSTEGETKKRTLESGDIAGISALYD